MPVGGSMAGGNGSLAVRKQRLIIGEWRVRKHWVGKNRQKGYADEAATLNKLIILLGWGVLG